MPSKLSCKQIIAGTLALLCLGIMIPRANAQASLSIDDLLKQIQSLKQQIEQMVIAIQNLKNQQTPICTRTLGATPSAGEIAECAKASGTISCADNKCACSCLAPVGGNCTYAAFEGKCKVLSVADNAGASPTIKYLFTPAKTLTDADMSGTSLTAAAANAYEGQTAASYLGLLCLKGSFDPTAELVKQCGIVENAEFTCTLSVEKTGTCTPVYAKFSDKPCANGNTRKFTCPDNEAVEWCTCADEKWTCVQSPEIGCKKACAITGSLVYKNGSLGPTHCCSRDDGIKSSNLLVSGLCTAAADGSVGTCVSKWWLTCGDGKCDGATENICNCAADCAEKECDETCESLGYTKSKCHPSALNSNGSVNICPTGYVAAGSTAKNCQNDSSGGNVVKTCCCAKSCAAEGETIDSSGQKSCCPGLKAVGTNTDCAPETDCINDSWVCRKTECANAGETVYSEWTGNTPTACCKGYKPIANCSKDGECPNNGSSVCADCGDGDCAEPYENAYNCVRDCGSGDSIAQAACEDTGGSWLWSNCASGCLAKNKSERLKHDDLCAAVCTKGYVCKCPNSTYWASMSEGCLENNAGESESNDD